MYSRRKVSRVWRQITVITSQVLLWHLLEKLLLLPEYVVARLSFPARDVSSWAPRNRQPQGCDTTRLNAATPNLPHWTMQGHDVQNGSNESMRA